MRKALSIVAALALALSSACGGSDDDDDDNSGNPSSGGSLSGVLGGLGLSGSSSSSGSGGGGGGDPGNPSGGGGGGDCLGNCAVLESCIEGVCARQFPEGVCNEICASEEIPAVTCGEVQTAIESEGGGSESFCSGIFGDPNAPPTHGGSTDPICSEACAIGAGLCGESEFHHECLQGCEEFLASGAPQSTIDQIMGCIRGSSTCDQFESCTPEGGGS